MYGIEPEYLGDSVYASYDGHHIVLTTGHHDRQKAGHIIYLDGEVVANLKKFERKILSMLEASGDDDGPF